MSDTKVVWKYPISIGAVGDVFDWPKGSKVVHVDVQNLNAFLWVERPHNFDGMETRTFIVVGTGRTIPAGHTHVGTFQSGRFVWHIYEKTS